MSTTNDMIAQLRAMVQLTQTEVQVARIRVSQARTEAVRRELTENARNAERRTEELTRELQRLGGVADVVSPLVGRVGAVVKATVEQAGPVDEALLGDLTLEHQLRDRAVYLRALAEAAKDNGVTKLAERIQKAHEATIEWLTTVLAEHALGGPPALRPTPLQMVAGGATRAVSLPVNFAREQVSRCRRAPAAASVTRSAPSSPTPPAAPRASARTPATWSSPAATPRSTAPRRSAAVRAPPTPPRRCTRPAPGSGRCTPRSSRSASTTSSA